MWTGALHYYAAVQATRMSFWELFLHLEQFIESPERRWGHCLRVKKGLADTSAPGAFGRDQCYFTGAVKLLQLRRHIDFVKLHAAKVSVEEIGRVADKISLEGVNLPWFMRDVPDYHKYLDRVAAENGIKHKALPVSPPRSLAKGDSEGKVIPASCENAIH